MKKDAIKNEIKNLPKEYRTIEDINKADTLYYLLAKEEYKERTGKKIARGFESGKNPEYRRFKNTMYKRRGRFKDRVLEDVETGQVMVQPVSRTEAVPFWEGVWYKGGGDPKASLQKNMVPGGDFQAIIKKVSTDSSGNKIILDTIKANNDYTLTRDLKSIYQDLNQKKRKDKNYSGKYFFTSSRSYQIGKLTILEIEIEMDS